LVNDIVIIFSISAVQYNTHAEKNVNSNSVFVKYTIEKKVSLSIHAHKHIS